MNEPWALAELEKLLRLLDYRDKPGLYAATYLGSDDDITAQRVVAEHIWERIIGPLPNEDATGRDRYRDLRAWTIRTVETLSRSQELRANLGDDAPDLSAASMHPWVWEGAQSLWRSGHYGEAVQAAGRKVNAETQNLLGRRDISEADLFVQAFSEDPPQPGRPRLHLAGDDDGKTARSVRRGVRAFAEGWFAAIRNPAAHDGPELSEAEALESLAALSVLARWVDSAELRT